ncbi:MAG: DUF1501 domain-containing protein [Verrucomicrobiaceae bacterium]|nr:DUF1501 domain-containing protein [Verrucomicrobiaceae bacterium]
MNILIRKTLDRSKPNRRDFMLQSTAASIGATSLVNTIAQLKLVGAAAAQSGGSDYKALVCIFLNGGMDTNNLLLPIASGSTARQKYEAGRGVPQYAGGSGGIAIPTADVYAAGTELNPLNPVSDYEPAAGYIGADGSGNTMALHPGTENFKAMFESEDLALVANVGTLAQPNVTRANFNTLPKSQKPAQLFSHSDQQVQWQSSISDKPFTSGWGGRVADILDGLYNTDPDALAMSVSINGVNSFQKGVQQQPYVMGSSGVSSFSGYGSPYTSALVSTGLQPFAGYDPFTTPGSVGSNYQNNNAGWRLAGFEQIMAMSHDSLFDQGYVDVAKNARVTEGLVGNALAVTDTGNGTTALDTFFTNAFAGSGLNPANEDFARQLKMAARLIIGNTVLGNQRQVFFTQLGGWDTHTSQIPVLNGAARTDQGYYKLVRVLSCAVRGFYDSINSVPGLWDKVMAFSASDFTRTLTPNKTDATGGSDHAWGGHMFVAGGKVRGKRIFGTFPELTVNGGIDCSGNRGRWIPSTSVDQYAAVISKWFGLDSGQIGAVFPNLHRFTDPFTPAAKLDFVDYA